MKRFTQDFPARSREGTSGGSVPRVCFTPQIRTDRPAEYRERHAAVWPGMLRALRDAGWHDYQLPSSSRPTAATVPASTNWTSSSTSTPT
jgi:hypothetical protein